MSAKRRIMVAGVGNIFLGDDAFGVEVAQRLRKETMPPEVHVEDFGIRGMHLAYALLEGYDTLILVDAASQGEPPGAVFVVEPDLENREGKDNPFIVDAHSLDPEVVLGMVENLGGKIHRVLIVGCEPVEIVERIGVSAAIEKAIVEAMALVRELVAEELKREHPAARTIAAPA